MSNIIFLLLLCIKTTNAVELKEFSIDYLHFHPSNRILEIPGMTGKESLKLNANLHLGGPFFWNNHIRGITDDGGYKFVDWNFQLGMKVLPSVQIYYEHRSGHILDHTDAVYPAEKFPVADAAGITWVIYAN